MKGLRWRMLFEWSQDARDPENTLRVWVRPPDAAWECHKVTPNREGRYELHAFGRRLMDVAPEIVDMLVKLSPYMG